MSISAASASAAKQAAIKQDLEVAVMKKARDVQKDTANALLDLVKQAAPPLPDHVGTQLNVLA